jgi:hypothetical protein
MQKKSSGVNRVYVTAVPAGSGCMNAASIGANVSVTEVGAGAVVANVVLPFCSASRTGGVSFLSITGRQSMP